MLHGAVGNALPGTEPIASKSAEAVLPGRRIITRACIRDVREPKRVEQAVLTCAAKTPAISLSFGRIHETTRHSRRVVPRRVAGRRCSHPKSNHTLEQPEDPEEPGDPVSIPDHFHIVRGVNDAHPQLLQRNDHDSVKEFYWRAAWALHQSDPKFGFLSKSPGEAHQVIEGTRTAQDAAAGVRNGWRWRRD